MKTTKTQHNKNKTTKNVLKKASDLLTFAARKHILKYERRAQNVKFFDEIMEEWNQNGIDNM